MALILAVEDAPNGLSKLHGKTIHIVGAVMNVEGSVHKLHVGLSVPFHDNAKALKISIVISMKMKNGKITTSHNRTISVSPIINSNNEPVLQANTRIFLDSVC